MKRLITFTLILVMVFSLAPSAFAAEKGYEKGAASLSTYTNSIGNQYAIVYFEIVNTSDKPLYCRSGKAEIEDESGALVKSSDMISCIPQIIEPGETGYYVDSLSIDPPVDGVLSLYAKPKADTAKVKNIRLDVSDVNFEDSTFGLKVRGRVHNETGEDLDGLISVAVLTFGESGDFLGYFSTALTEDLEDGDRTSFEMSSFNIPRSVSAQDIYSYMAFAYPLQMQW